VPAGSPSPPPGLPLPPEPRNGWHRGLGSSALAPQCWLLSVGPAMVGAAVLAPQRWPCNGWPAMVGPQCWPAMVGSSALALQWLACNGWPAVLACNGWLISVGPAMVGLQWLACNGWPAVLARSIDPLRLIRCGSRVDQTTGLHATSSAKAFASPSPTSDRSGIVA
jgi:hypothetical protein